MAATVTTTMATFPPPPSSPTLIPFPYHQLSQPSSRKLLPSSPPLHHQHHFHQHYQHLHPYQHPRDGGAWWAAVSGVTQSRIRLKRLSSSSSTIISTVTTVTKAIFSTEFPFLSPLFFFFGVGIATVNMITINPEAEVVIKAHSILECQPLGSWGK